MGYNQNSLNLGAAGSEKNLWGLRQEEGKKKKKEQWQHNGLELFSHGGFINLSVNPTFNGQLISSLRE